MRRRRPSPRFPPLTSTVRLPSMFSRRMGGVRSVIIASTLRYVC